MLYNESRVIVDNYINWIEKLDKSGEYDMYIITFMFKHFNIRDEESIISIMENDINRFFSTIITRIVRKPHRIKFQKNVPIFILSPDVPVYKNTSCFPTSRRVNNGLHFHGIAIIPKECRLKTSLDKHINCNRSIYINKKTSIININVIKIISTPGYVCNYIFKNLKKFVFNVDQILILPKSIVELE